MSIRLPGPRGVSSRALKLKPSRVIYSGHNVARDEAEDAAAVIVSWAAVAPKPKRTAPEFPPPLLAKLHMCTTNVRHTKNGTICPGG